LQNTGLPKLRQEPPETKLPHRPLHSNRKKEYLLTTFENLSLIPQILKSLTEEGYTTPTPIQEKAIPHILQQRDLLGCAQTGTGKTAAFAIPILQLLKTRQDQDRRKKVIRALILTPTRELAIQIEDSFKAYGRHTGLTKLVIFGGVGQKPQTDGLAAGTDILVATPGRLLDLIQQGFVNLRHIEIFVLDEADRMLDMGFIHDVKRVISNLPANRQTLLFSATMPSEIQKLAAGILKNPVYVEVTPVSSTAEKVEQSVYFVDKENKKHLLVHLLRDHTLESVLVFTRTKHGADRVGRDLNRLGVQAEVIHGDKSQTARQRALANFKEGISRVLIATDIAARGIDIDDLSHVINYELPNVPETYVHRIGRTGRAGASGIAISFCDIEEKDYLKDIHKLTGLKIPSVENHPWPMKVFEVPEKPKQKPARRPEARHSKPGSSFSSGKRPERKKSI